MGEVNIRGFKYFEDKIYTDWDNPEKKFKIIICKGKIKG